MSEITIIDQIIDKIDEAQLKISTEDRSDKLEAIYIGRSEQEQFRLKLLNEPEGFVKGWRPDVDKPFLEGLTFNGLKIHLVNEETHLRIV